MSFQRLVAPTMLAGIELIIYVYSQSETKRDSEWKWKGDGYK